MFASGATRVDNGVLNIPTLDKMPNNPTVFDIEADLNADIAHIADIARMKARVSAGANLEAVEEEAQLPLLVAPAQLDLIDVDVPVTQPLNPADDDRS